MYNKRKENIMNVKIIVLSYWAIIEELREAQLPVMISSAEHVHIVILARRVYYYVTYL